MDVPGSHPLPTTRHPSVREHLVQCSVSFCALHSRTHTLVTNDRIAGTTGPSRERGMCGMRLPFLCMTYAASRSWTNLTVKLWLHAIN